MVASKFAGRAWTIGRRGHAKNDALRCGLSRRGLASFSAIPQDFGLDA
jgi:hypothetical protein